jgi:hypothetical protein
MARARRKARIVSWDDASQEWSMLVPTREIAETKRRQLMRGLATSNIGLPAAANSLCSYVAPAIGGA